MHTCSVAEHYAGIQCKGKGTRGQTTRNSKSTFLFSLQLDSTSNNVVQLAFSLLILRENVSPKPPPPFLISLFIQGRTLNIINIYSKPGYLTK